MNKKSIIFLIAGLLFTSIIAEAQVQVVSDGTFRVGVDNYDPGNRDFTVMDVQNPTSTSLDAYTSVLVDNVNNFLYLNRKSTSYRNEIVWYSYTIPKWHIGLNDHDDTPDANPNGFFIGENIGGSSPFIFLDATYNNIGLFTNEPDDSYELTLIGDALAYGGDWHSSDIVLKQNINTIESSLQKLLSIRGVTYENNSEYKNLVSHDTSESQKNTYLDSLGIEQSNGENEISNPLPDTRYGVIAQEVMEQFPDLVHKGSNGYYAVNYDGLIPVLIESIKEQQSLIEEIQNELEGIKQTSLKSLTSVSENEAELKTPILFQNNPNPFSENTSIKYFLPKTIKEGKINIYDLQGKQLKTFEITQTDDGEIHIAGSTFEPGIFIYNLIIDGVVIDSKQMILTVH